MRLRARSGFRLLPERGGSVLLVILENGSAGPYWKCQIVRSRNNARETSGSADTKSQELPMLRSGPAVCIWFLGKRFEYHQYLCLRARRITCVYVNYLAQFSYKAGIYVTVR